MDQSTSQPTINPMPTPQIPPEIPQKPKNNKLVIIVLSVLLAISLIAVGIFAYLYFSNQNSQEQPTDDTSQITGSTPSNNEEVEITDELLINDLDEKIAILHDTDQTGSILTSSIGLHHEYPLYIKGTLSEIAKVAHLMRTISQTFLLNSEEKESIISERRYEDTYLIDSVRKDQIEGVKADVFSAKYVSLFGEQPPKEEINQQRYCPGVYYNTTYDFYYFDIIGCGGTGPYTSSYFKTKYTTDDSHAYVYISAGTVNGDDNKIYCDVINIETVEETMPDTCGEWEDDSYKFTLDDSNYQDFARYRFVFNKAEDGTYYFDKVEKLN